MKIVSAGLLYKEMRFLLYEWNKKRKGRTEGRKN
jgi:hypothetical protein